MLHAAGPTYHSGTLMRGAAQVVSRSHLTRSDGESPCICSRKSRVHLHETPVKCLSHTMPPEHRGLTLAKLCLSNVPFRVRPQRVHGVASIHTHSELIWFTAWLSLSLVVVHDFVFPGTRFALCHVELVLLVLSVRV